MEKRQKTNNLRVEKTDNSIEGNAEEQQKTNNPHDKGYKRIFKIKKNFLDFIKKYVAMDWMAELTVDDIELVDKEFVTDQFETYESDFVYKIHVKNREVYMFFL